MSSVEVVTLIEPLNYTVRWRMGSAASWETVVGIDNRNSALFAYVKAIVNGALEVRIESSEGGLYAHHRRREG